MSEKAMTPKMYVLTEVALPGERVIEVAKSWKETLSEQDAADLTAWATAEMTARGIPIKDPA